MTALSLSVLLSPYSVLPEDLPQDLLRSICQLLLDRLWEVVTEARSFSATSTPAASRLLDGKHPRASQAHVGRSVVVMRNSLYVMAERARNARRRVIDGAAVAVQKSFKGFASRRQFEAQKEAFVKVRVVASVRGCLSTLVPHLRACVCVCVCCVQLQAMYRGVRGRRNVRQIIASGETIKSIFLMLRERAVFRRQRNAAMRIQSEFRVRVQRGVGVSTRPAAHLCAR